MKYYQNKTTGEIIGVENMRQVIDMPTEAQTKIGYKDYSYHVVYDMICPNYLIPNGVRSFCISHQYLTHNYKRIKMDIALNKYPTFHQYRYEDLDAEAARLSKTRLDIIRGQKF